MVSMISTIPANAQAHKLLLKQGWSFLSTTGGESGYYHSSLCENTLIVSPSGAWRLIEPTAYTESLRADGLPDDMEESLQELLKENNG